MTLHLCTPRGYHWRSIRHCPTCERRRWMLVSEYVWYGPSITCLGCGDAWQEGERLPRPFARGWRDQSVARARSTGFTTKAAARASLRAELDEMLESHQQMKGTT